MRRALPGALLLAALGRCASGVASPVSIDPRSDACAWCRMTISDARFAAQLVAPAEEPKLFDDIGCLRDYLSGGATVPAGAVAFVADHRTRAFIVASRAIYRRIPDTATPMASGLAAWADESSRAADPESSVGAPRTVEGVFGPTGPPEGKP